MKAHKLPYEGLIVGGQRVHMPFWPLPNRAALLEHFHNVARIAPDEFTSSLVFTSVPVIYVSAWIGDRCASNKRNVVVVIFCSPVLTPMT